MAVSDLGYWELVAVVLLRVVTVVLVLLAFLALRRTEPVVLRARIFMNYRNVQSGLLALAVAMSLFLLQAVVETAHVHWDGNRLPLEVTAAIFLGGTAFLLVGFWRFYTLPRPSAGNSGGRR